MTIGAVKGAVNGTSADGMGTALSATIRRTSVSIPVRQRTAKLAQSVMLPSFVRLLDVPSGEQILREIAGWTGYIDAAIRSALGANLTGTNKWIGGVLAPDGKIYGIPFSATDVLIIDPIAQTATRSTLGANLTGAAKWLGGVLGPDGKIYGIPFSATDILIASGIATGHTRPNSSAALLSAYFNKL